MPRRASGNDNGSRRFSTTRWSLVLAAADSRHPDCKAALGELCSAYWYPVYAFVRRQGHDANDAQDLTQGFFTELLEKRTLKAARRERGRFRSFLLAALKFYLSHVRERASALKRGGGKVAVRFDADTAESRYRLEPQESDTPETLFERRWAILLLERALDRLRSELERTARPQRSLALMRYLDGNEPGWSYKRLAAELGMTESAVKVAIHRLRGRYRKALREEVLQTVDDPHRIDDELQYLSAVLGKN